MPSLDVLYEDNHLLVVNKQPGLATMGAGAGQPSVVALAKAYLRSKYHKPGNVYVGVVSRLDAWASGVLVLARTSKAAGRLSEQFRERRVRKVYWALLPARPTPAQGQWIDTLARDDAAQRTIVVPAGAGQRAALGYRALRAVAGAWLVEFELETGRKHQIRAQCAARGLPILGDRKYGSRLPLAPQTIALHARHLELEHPVRRQPLSFTAAPPAAWAALGIAE